MNIKTIKDIAYTIKYCKEHNKPMPIVLCGAGISITANIPGTGKIIEDVFEKFAEKSEIRNLKMKNCTDYYTIMRALRVEERQDLFKGYIESENVKLNLASIYLAQLLKEKYLDFVFTVNFDDVLLKASALFNFIPPIYDLANVDSLTSNNFVKNALVYLHGQYYGQWLLNTREEINKGLQNVHNLFQRECNRPWIVVGYSGEDEIFKKLNEITSFASDLYWVSYDDNNLNKDVKNELLELPNKNAYLISNIDADTFFLELCTELKLDYPPIFGKPFTFLESYFDKIQDFKTPNENYKIIYQNLSKQKEISLKWIKEAKDNIENSKSLESFQQDIIDAILKNDFSEEKQKLFEEEINRRNYTDAEEQLSWYYGEWGNALSALARMKGDDGLFYKSFEKYKKSSALNPTHSLIFYNWGTALSDLAKMNKDVGLFLESFEKYQKSGELNPKDSDTFYNWGNALYALAKMNGDDGLFYESFEKYKKSSELNPTDSDIFNNWGIALSDLAKMNGDEGLFHESFEKYKKSSELNPLDSDTFYNWGTALSALAEMNGNEGLFLESFEKYKKSGELNSTHSYTFYNWGTALSALAEMNGDEGLFHESFEKYKKSSELNPKDYSIFNNWGSALYALAKMNGDEGLWTKAEVILLKGISFGGEVYNLACFYALRNNKEQAFKYLKQALENKEITTILVEEDEDWKDLKNEKEFKELMN